MSENLFFIWFFDENLKQWVHSRNLPRAVTYAEAQIYFEEHEELTARVQYKIFPICFNPNTLPNTECVFTKKEK